MRRYLMQTLAYSLQRRVRIRSGGLWTLLTLIGLTISPQMLQAQCPDGLPPVVSGCPTNININVAPGSCANTATWTPPSFVPGGLCGITGLTSSHSPGATFPVGTTTVTYTATDAGGLSTSCSFDVIVTDNENPSLTACPANITIPAVGCTANPTWTAPTATDNCPGVILTSTANSGDAFNVGTTTVTYTATDLEGNVVTCSFTVTVTETVDPIINCPGAITINADAGLCTGTVASALATATDNCATPTITSDAPGGGADIAGSYPVGTTTVTFTATDDAGNTATCTTLITVVDNEAPSFTNCPVGLQTVNVAPGTCAGVFNYTPTFSDNCPGATVAQTSGPTVGTSQAPGSYTVAFTVTDAAGLQAVCTINYEVVDNEAPTITNCPAAVNNLNVDAATCGAVFTFNPTANDNCAVTSFVRTDATGLVSGDVFPVGTTTISYLASDAEGNTTPCSFDVVVTDNVAPVFTTCPTNITVNVDGGSCTATVSTLALAVATDDCGIASIINDFNGGGADANGTYPLGMTTVTFTATDNNGLTNNTCTVEVTVIDNIPPTITCPTNATLNLSGDANTTDCVYTIAGTALDAVPADNCTGASISNDFNASATLDGASFPLGTTTVNWTVTDGAGLTATCAFDVTVVDDVAPVITCPANIVVDTDPGNCGAVVNYTVTANDACDGAITPVAGPGVQLSGATFSVGTTVVSYSATDAAGNVSNCSFTVTVNDNEAPVLNCQNITVQLDASGNVSITPADVDDPVVPSNDNCSVVLSVSPNSFDCSTVGPQTVTLTGTDPAGNTSSCTTTVTVEDNVAPVANCQNITVQLDASGNASITAAQIDNGSNDACGIMSLAVSPNTFTCTEVGANTVTLTVTDNNNNVSTCTATVTVEDNVAPVANCQDITVQLDASGNASITAAQINNGSSDACGIMSLAVSPNTFTCADVGANTVTLTVTDNNNNVSTCTATVTVEDNVAPTAVCISSPLIVPVNNVVSITAAQIDDGSTDACGIANYAVSPSTFTCANVGANTVTLTVTDNNGNSSSCTATVMIVDNNPPTALCQPHTVTLDANGNGSMTAADIDGGSSDNCGIATVVASQTAFTCADAAVSPVPVTLTVTDVNGNVSTCVAQVSVQDVTNPVITCPAAITVSADPGQCTAVVTSLGLATATDECGIASIVNDFNANGADANGTYNVGTRNVTFLATDNNGNVATCVVAVTVEDNELPTITCNGDITVSNFPGLCTAPVPYVVIANDNCPGFTVAQTAGLASGAQFPVGTTTNTFVVTDASGNTATCSFDVTVEDNQSPSIICPPDLVVNNDPGICGAVINYTPPMGVDNCPLPANATQLTSGPAPGATFPVGITTVEYTVTDAVGQTAVCTFDVTVNDNENPVFTGCPNNITVGNDLGACGANVNWIPPVGSDNCSATITASHNPGDFFPVGTTVVSYTATDAAGNVGVCTFNVTVNDTELPTITCPANIVVGTDPGQCDAVVNYSVTGNDNCPGFNISQTAGLASGATFPLGATTVTYEITDAAGNTANCSFIVTVNDTENPALTCPANITVNNTPGLCEAVVTYAAPVGTDNCPGVSTALFNGLASGSAFPVGVNTVTYRATDAAGNTTDCFFTVTVIDNEDPTIVCSIPVLQTADPGVCGANVTFSAPVTADNCPGEGVSLISGIPNGGFFPVGTTTNTYRVTDASGNTADCSFTITITDDEDPVVTCPADIVQSNDAGVCEANVTVPNPTITDNCPGPFTITNDYNNTNDASDIYPVGITTVTFTITDPAGNTTTCSMNVTVEDTENPTILCPFPSQIALNGAGIVDLSQLPFFNQSVDNCGPVTISFAPKTIYDCSDAGTTTVITITATDGAGNTNSCITALTVVDNVSPTVNCPANITTPVDPGLCSAVVTYAAPTFSDNCPGSTIVQTAGLISGSIFPVGVTTNSFEVTDAVGNVSVCSFDVTVVDSENPTITCPANIVQANDAGLCSAVITYAVGFGDNCPGATLTQTAGLPSGSAFPVGTTTNTFVVTDLVGNSVTCSFDVTINDTEDPVITCPADITVQATTGLCEAVVNYTIPTVTDNCVPSPIPTLTGGLGSGAAFPVGTTTETYSFTDPSGNTVSCSFTVTVEDNVAPALTCPANITVNNDAGLCGAVVSWTVPTPVDNCAGSAIAGYTLLGSFAGNDYYISNTPSDWATASLAAQATGGHLAVIETAAENAFIAGAIGADLHWIGYTDAAVEGTFEWVTGIQSAFESWTPGEPNDFGGVEDHAAIFNNGLWLDLDGTSARLSILEIGTSQLNSPAPGSLFPVGTTTVSYQAVDVNGNVATCSFDVTVLDVEDPTIACPANITVNNDPGDCGAVVTYADPTTTDNCPGETVTQTAGLASGMSFPVGTTTNTFVVTDASGNTATCSFDVTVNDTEAPTIVCPTAVIVNNDPGLCSAVVTYAMPVSADNCPGITVVQTAGLPSGSVFLVGTTTNTFVVTDAAGLTATCSFDVTVNDTENPTIVCPANITQSVDPGSCDAVVTYTPPVGTDNCNSTTVLTTAGFGSGATFPLGTTTVTYTVTDASGNTASCSFDVTIVDQDPPTINCPADITVSAPMGTCDAVVTYAAVTATDGCPGIGAVVQTAGLASGSTFPVGVTTNTFEVTDAAGNTSTCSFDVTVEDNEDPVITCPADITVFANGGQCTALVNYTGASATDNCGIPTVNLISGLGSGGSFPVGVNTETYQAVDASGNTATCSFTITVVDNQDPTITCPADIVMGNDPGVCGATVTFADPTFNDNCPGSILTQTAGQASGTVFPIGTTTNTFVITDPSGNTATCSFDVTVNDTEAPVISCPANITVTAGPGLCDEIVIYPGVTATDNCPGAPTISLIAGLSSGANFPVGITTVTYEAEDAIGNISTCSFTVNVLAAVPITQATINTPVNAITMAAELCEDEDLTLSASVPNAGTGEVGTWSFVGTAPASFTFLPDANDPNAVLSGITASPPVYELEWAITDGCITTRDTILIQVNPKPSGVILETMPISAFGASDGELLALPLSGTPGYFFQWDNAPANSTTPSISGLATGTYTVVISDTKGCDDTLSYFLDQPAAQTVLVSPKVILGGAVDIITGEMNDNLRGLADFPLTEPYTAAGFPALNAGSSLTTNAGVLSVTGSDAIVDWILVEIRDKTDRSVLLGRQPALLQADGDIVDAGDGVSPVAIIGTPDDYYVAIRHRNHLGVMSDAVLSLNDATTTLADFTDGSVVAYQLPLANALSRAPLQVLSGPAFATTTFGLWGGDSNGDKVVTYAGATSDLSPVSIKVLTDLGNPTFSLTYQVPGYNIEDLNMDGLVTYAGSATEITVITINVLLHPDNVSPPFSLSFQIYEQIP